MALLRNDPRAARRRRLVLATLIPLALLVAAMASAGAAWSMPVSTGSSAPWIASDQADYPPGATVVLNGGAWRPGDTIHVVVDDATGHTWQRTVDLTADENGSVQDQFSLPSTFVAEYSVTAADVTNGVDGASASFTDGSLQVQGAGAPAGAFTFNVTLTGYDDAACTVNPGTPSVS